MPGKKSARGASEASPDRADDFAKTFYALEDDFREVREASEGYRGYARENIIWRRVRRATKRTPSFSER